MKMREIMTLVETNNRPVDVISETATFLIDLGERHVLLKEQRLDEIGITSKLGNLLQSSAPVRAFDSLAERLIEKIRDACAENYPNITSAVEGYAAWAKENPIKQGLILGVLTAISSLMTGPGGGAAAGYVLRFVGELLKGEKLSTAIGKGLESTAVGWFIGSSIKGASDLMQVEVKDIPGYQAVKSIRSSAAFNGKTIFLDIDLPGELAEKAEAIFANAKARLEQGKPEVAAALIKDLNKALDSPKIMRVVQQRMEGNEVLIKHAEEALAKSKRTLGMISAALQGALAPITDIESTLSKKGEDVKAQKDAERALANAEFYSNWAQQTYDSSSYSDSYDDDEPRRYSEPAPERRDGRLRYYNFKESKTPLINITINPGRNDEFSCSVDFRKASSFFRSTGVSNDPNEHDFVVGTQKRLVNISSLRPEFWEGLGSLMLQSGMKDGWNSFYYTTDFDDVKDDVLNGRYDSEIGYLY